MLINDVIIADSGRKVNICVSKGKITEISASNSSPLERRRGGKNDGRDVLTGREEHTPAPLSRGDSHSSAVSFNDAIEPQINFTNAIVFPGLINSHDHLDFNLFPQLGSRKYNSYTEWGNYIQQEYKKQIADVLKVPQALRSQWGMYKNMLCGVTTVVNHGNGSDFADKLITIFDKKHDIHSVGFDKRWKLRLNNPLKRKLHVVIHAGEGIDTAAGDEIDALIKSNKLHRKLVVVHGVAMQPRQALKFNALVWCPESNYFLLNKTAPVNKLKLYTRVLFGTDSTLTGHWDIWEHIRLAHQTGLLTNQELYRALTRNGAEEWGLNSGELAVGKDADIVVAKNKDDRSSYNTFFKLTPADILLVMHKGEIRLADESIYSQIKDKLTAIYTKVKIGDSYKYIQGTPGALITAIQRYWPQAPFPVSVHRDE